MATKLTYEKLIDICNARDTKHVWYTNKVNGCKVSFSYDDCGDYMHVGVGALICITFDRCTPNKQTEDIVDLYKKDVFVGCLDIEDLEVWE